MSNKIQFEHLQKWKKEQRRQKPKEVKILSFEGLDDKTKDVLRRRCFFVGELIENETLFYEIQNDLGDLVRIFPERVQIK